MGRIFFLNRGNEMESFHFLTAQNEKNGAVRQSVQSHFHVFRLRPYDLGVPELFVVLVVFTVGFAVGVAVAVLVVPAAVAVVVAAFAATFGCSSQWKGSKLVFGSTQVGFLQA